MKSIALIGCGYWGSKIEKYIHNYFNLKYIADSKFDLNIIFNDADICGVIIATPIETHFEIAKRAIIAGKHVFLEKPITKKISEAVELLTLSKKYNVNIGINYVLQFSSGIKYILNYLKDKNIGYIEMYTKHLGRFMEHDVYWLLASHHLAVLSKLINLNDCNFVYNDLLFNNSICTTGEIQCFDIYKSKRLATIGVSLNFFEKDFTINIYGDGYFIKYNPLSKITTEIIEYNKEYKKLPNELIVGSHKLSIDESNNLNNSIEYFYNLINGQEESNIFDAITITKILERHG